VLVECVGLACLCFGAWCSILCLQEAFPCFGSCFSIGNSFFLQQETAGPPCSVYHGDAHSAWCFTLSTNIYGVWNFTNSTPPTSPISLDQSWHSYTFASSPGLSNSICLRHPLTVHFSANMSSDIYARLTNGGTQDQK
jgi:hypothetical protein